MILEHTSEKQTWFTGRNGTFYMKGWTMFDSSTGGIDINPLTSKGKMGNCMIEIAKEDIDTFIDHLRRIQATLK